MRLVLLTLALFALPQLAIGQNRAVSQSPTLDVSIDGPVWMEGAQSSLQTGVGGSGSPVTITEFIPEGQSFDTWQELFAIMIEENIGLSLDVYANQQIGRFVGGCNTQPEDVMIFANDPKYILFAVPCGHYERAPETGEVALFFVVRADPHLVKIYQHFRGPAFEISDRSDWPVSQGQMNHFFNNLNGLQISGR